MAAGGSLRGVVKDTSGATLGKVTVTLFGVNFDFEKVTSTDKKGKFDFTVSDAEKDYSIRLEKEGYVSIEQPVKLSSGQVIGSEWLLATTEEAAKLGEQLQQLEAQDKATQAYNRGVEAYNAGDTEGAIAGFREAIELNPTLELGHAALGRILLETARWGEARAAAEAFLAVSPDQPLALQTLYDAYWGEGNKAEADKVLNRLMTVEPGGAVAARIFNQAVAATKKQDYEAAARGFAQAYELDSTIYQALLPLAQIHFANGEWQPAVDKAEKYLEHDKANPRANIVRYLSYQELGNQEAADQAFAELSQNSPAAAAEMFLRDGINFFNDGSIPESIEAVEISIKLDPSNPQAHHQLGLCYASSGENSKARAAFERFLELAPDDPEATTVKEMLSYLK
jgi:tetratricopeptide (TPR) repeat protein